MSSDIIKVRVRSGPNEAEIEAPLAHVHEALDLIPEMVHRLPEGAHARVQQPSMSELGQPLPAQEAQPSASPPLIVVEKGDSLNDIILKFFSDAWGKSPKKLLEVREALQSYGLNYPKQSVAVALLRLAKTSKIRRFKSEGGEYVYTASTSMMPAQVLVIPDTEAPPVVENPANL